MSTGAGFEGSDIWSLFAGAVEAEVLLAGFAGSEEEVAGLAAASFDDGDDDGCGLDEASFDDGDDDDCGLDEASFDDGDDDDCGLDEASFDDDDELEDGVDFELESPTRIRDLPGGAVPLHESDQRVASPTSAVFGASRPEKPSGRPDTGARARIGC